MMPIDFLVMALAAASLLYLPFAAARVVTGLLFEKRRKPITSSTIALLDPTATTPDSAGVPLGALSTSERPGSEVPDVRGLIDYLSEQRGGEAQALLTRLLTEDSANRLAALRGRG